MRLAKPVISLPTLHLISDAAVTIFRLTQISKMTTSRLHRLAYNALLVNGFFGRVVPWLFSSLAPSGSGVANCLSPSCPDVPLSQVHMRAVQRAHVIAEKSHPFRSFLYRSLGLLNWPKMQEFFRFRNDDPREKFLIVSASSDHNDALNPLKKTHSAMYEELAKKYDVRYQIVRTSEELCKAVESGVQTGPMAGILTQLAPYSWLRAERNT